MALITVNLDRLVEGVATAMPNPRATKKILQALGAAARAEWIGLAQNELKSTSRDYVQGISKPVLTDRSATLTLTGVLPNMVEQGWPETDLRQTLLNGPNAQTSADGHRYARIPFRHGTPGTSKRNVGLPMPKPIHNVAKMLAPTLTGVGGLGRQQKRSILDPQSEQSRRLRPGMQGLSKKASALMLLKQKEWHSGSIYSGMIRQVSSYETSGGETKTQSSYLTFRTISDAPGADPRSWMHPGIKARDLAQKVQKFVAEVATQIVKDALDE